MAKLKGVVVLSTRDDRPTTIDSKDYPLRKVRLHVQEHPERSAAFDLYFQGPWGECLVHEIFGLGHTGPYEENIIGVYMTEAEVSDDKETITLTLKRRRRPKDAEVEIGVVSEDPPVLGYRIKTFGGL